MKPTLTYLVERVGDPDSQLELVYLICLLLLLCLLFLERNENGDPESQLAVLCLVLDLTFALTHPDSRQLGPAIPTNRFRPPLKMAGDCNQELQTRISRIATNFPEASPAANECGQTNLNRALIVSNVFRSGKQT